MRVLRNVQDVGGENLTGKLRLVPVRNLWNEWEIHCLIVASLALQFLLFFTAAMRKRSTSRHLGRVLWLAYLSADFVAVLVLGHLAVCASGSQHELIVFWAPFLLVHLGGQDTITALSMQDNVLWTRHLLGFVSQVAVAGYVVSKSSWPDKRLLAATMLVFLSGSFKYAARTYCLYSARPAYIKDESVRILSRTLGRLKSVAEDVGGEGTSDESLRQYVRNFWDDKFDWMLGKSNKMDLLVEDEEDAMEIMSLDAPQNTVESILVRDDLPSMLEKFQSTSYLHEPYEYVGRNLVKCYENLYTKRPLLHFCGLGVRAIFMGCHYFDIEACGIWILWLTVILLQYFPIPIALVLFTMAEKGQQVHNRADVTVSYILLIGAIILDVSSASVSILSSVRSNIFGGRIKIAALSVANYIQPAWSRRQWSEKLAQYNMVKQYRKVKRYTRGDARGMSYVRQWTGKRFIAWGVKLLDPRMTHTQVDEDLKEFVLNNMVRFGTKQQYNFADFRGQLALHEWMQLSLQEWRQNGPRMKALYYSINDVKDFPTSILIWHIATDICYYSGSSSSANTECDRSKKKKKMSRELSNYILYLVFKCGVMLTSSSQLVHNKVYDEMEKVLAGQWAQMVNPGAEAIMKLFEATKDKQPPLTVNERQKQPVDTDDATSSLLESTADAIYSPVLSHACKVAQELMGIDDEGKRWGLIAAVWSEMLYYTAPRCGSAFHYQHLSTGGEFITHVLHLMHSLGPFLPGPGNSAPVRPSTIDVPDDWITHVFIPG